MTISSSGVAWQAARRSAANSAADTAIILFTATPPFLLLPVYFPGNKQVFNGL
jgi:hypothetical protein